MIKRWPYMIGLLFLVGCGVAYALTDVTFLGRGLRMTKTSTTACATTTYDCKWFDTGDRERFYNGSTSLYTINSTESTPTKGKILYGNGTNWVSLTAPAGRQVLVVDKTDGGLKWISPTDGGLVLP